jgi:hypothetical protein
MILNIKNQKTSMTKNDLYKESFKTLVNIGFEKDTEICKYIGTGNPNSKILIVGKEGSCEKPPEGEICFAKHWFPKIENNELISFNRFYKRRLSEGHTWSKYQKLHDNIFPEYKEKQEKNEINFEERIFTTEMNINRSKISKEASKAGMQERKDTFFKSEFIQQFPVIILACGTYIKNNKKVREIDDIFGVEFVKEYKTDTPNPQSFWTHYNPDKTKLVIHTRQLSMAVSDDLLKDMAKVIKEHLKNLNNEE